MAEPPVANFTTDTMVTLVARSISSWDNQSNLSTNSSDSYAYDYEAFYREQHIYFIKEIITIVFYSLTMLVGTIGNTLVIYTIWRCRHLHTVMYTLLASLSVADLIMVVIVLPWYLKLTTYVGTWLWGEFLCRFPGYLQLLSAISSVFHLTAISMERCYAVMFPLKSRTKLTIGNAYKIIAVVWISAAIASIPHLFSVGVESIDIDGKTFQRCRPTWKNEEIKAYALYIFFIVFAIPFVQITGSYAFIIRTLYTRRIPSASGKNGSISLSQSRRYQQTGSASNGNGSVAVSRTSSVYVASNTTKLNRNATRNKEAEIRQMTAMLVVVIILFAVCWGPNLSFALYSRFHLDASERFTQKWILVSSAFQLLSLMNSACNPVIYALMSVSFRESCKWALQVCCKPRSVRRRMSAVSRANTVSRPGISTGCGSTAYDNVSESSHCAGEKL